MTDIHHKFRATSSQLAVSLGKLFSSYVQMDAVTFFDVSENRGLDKVVLPTVILGLTLSVWIFADISFPSARLVDRNAVLRGVITGWMISIILMLPVYLIMQARSNVRALSFYINLQLLSGALGQFALFVPIIAAAALSPQLMRDANLVGVGRGQQTPIYRDICTPLLNRRDLLSEKLALNAITREYDRQSHDSTGFWPWSTTANSDEMDNLSILVAEAELRMPPDVRARADQLRHDINRKTDSVTSLQVHIPIDYPVMIIAILFVALIECWILFANVVLVFRLHRAKDGWVGKALIRRVGLSVVASGLLTLVISYANQGQIISAANTLDAERADLRAQVSRFEGACGGHFSSKGLW